MALDPSISLQVQSPQINVPQMNPAQLMQMKNYMYQQQLQQIQLQEAQQGMEQKNALIGILKAPGAVENGIPTGDTLNKLMQVNPEAAMTMQENIAKLKEQQSKQATEALTQHLKQGEYDNQQADHMYDLSKSYDMKYDEYTKSMPSENAIQKLNKERSDEADDLLKTGKWTEKQVSFLRQPFNPHLNDLAVANAPKAIEEYKKQREEKSKNPVNVAVQGAEEISDLEDKLAKAKPGSPEAKRLQADIKAGQKTLEHKEEGVKVIVPGAGGMGSGKEGEKRGDLLAALAEKNVNLPAGMRSQQQIKATLDGLIKRNPDLSMDEIAQKIKTGKLDMVVASSEARTAGTGLGKVEWAVQEMDKTAPLVLEASKAVPRGDFMPVNKLLKKWKEGGIQDPNQKELAIYVNSMMNAYDLLASRGGTDKDKRAEAHALLTSADSPEGLERGIKAFLKEGEVSARAAGEAVENITQSKKKDDKQSSKPNVDHNAALEWANAHPNDPRAKTIKERAANGL